MNLLLILKSRLRQRTNKRYVKWRAEQKKQGAELHHLLGSYLGGKKQNDYLLAEITQLEHKRVHYKKPFDEAEFITHLIASLEGLFDYIEYLENQKE